MNVEAGFSGSGQVKLSVPLFGKFNAHSIMFVVLSVLIKVLE